ncbi:protein LKAAEAR1-like [Pangasianodon hypophthalmus]|uniref:protein LKAAEAR1-like n=1 Tax=Pangasianodon hypophthalmus TaxID=310915 RepID=UPI0023078CC7|nr:protein LKAAEAR1-like [Pangasianodon hypophthalmus]
MEKKCGNKKSVDLKRMCPQQKARSLAYAEPSKEVQAWMAASHQRVLSRLAHEREKAWEKNPFQDLDSKLRHDTLIGQLKAAEARNRIRQMRLQCHNLKMREISLMISSQASVQSAVRLELFLAKEKQRNNSDSLDQLQRRRVEEILEDEKGLTIIRR